jgi:hypothetical protein
MPLEVENSHGTRKVKTELLCLFTIIDAYEIPVKFIQT